MTALLPGLTAARKRAKPGETINAAGLAKLTGSTWRILAKRIEADADFPVLQRGDLGKDWKFEVVAVLDHMIARGKALKAERIRKGATAARLAGVSTGKGGTEAVDGSATPDSAADMASHARALKALTEAQMMSHRLKREQGEYVRADAVRALLHDVMTTMQTEALAVTAKLDPAGVWPAGLRAQVEDEMRTVLLHVQRKVVDGIARVAP
jgi:phage terminase Nu1 subunit (DNA packaging protein)